MTDKQPAASEERIESNIFFIRGQKIMLGIHLAEAYGIEPQALDKTVERNIESFPENSVFRLNPEESASLKLHHALSSQTAPYAFTRQGVATLSSILFDERAKHENQETCAPTCSCRK
ncbi:MAG: ORF6N domain-containing protein [Gallionella sp.]|nr:ORF6N domain-containing protein [Gallionella sp.]